MSETVTDGEQAATVLARWQANIPTYMADQYVSNLRRLRGIAFDVGTRDILVGANRQFTEALTRNKIEHAFEVFEGGHTDKVRERIETKMLPFMSQMLVLQRSAANAR